ncbi:hypothetical protein ABEB36_009222 [Hypothenemus hampei]|uniref:Uncharacterized protein n=1 Tax=Hypothenemus hampei TaxID=57062 RepID=A0ABD1EPJ3_HYPHA
MGTNFHVLLANVYNKSLIEVLQNIQYRRKPAEKSSRIDFVLFTWCDYNPDSKKCYVRYLSAPATDEQNKELRQRIRNLDKPLNEYDIFFVNLLGKASK